MRRSSTSKHVACVSSDRQGKTQCNGQEILPAANWVQATCLELTAERRTRARILPTTSLWTSTGASKLLAQSSRSCGTLLLSRAPSLGWAAMP